MTQARREPYTVQRRQEQRITPSGSYRLPILEALQEIGGRGSVQLVLQRLAEKMYYIFTEPDLQDIGGHRRWESMAHFERLAMSKKGLLSADSPRGQWEITDLGRAWLEENRGIGALDALQQECPNCGYVGGQIQTCNACGLEYCEKCMSDEGCPDCT